MPRGPLRHTNDIGRINIDGRKLVLLKIIIDARIVVRLLDLLLNLPVGVSPFLKDSVLFGLGRLFLLVFVVHTNFKFKLLFFELLIL